MGTARLQGLMGKAGKDPEQRRSVWECECQPYRPFQGLADQVVVAMISLIIKRWSKGPVDTAVAINGRGRPILRKEYRGQTSSPYSGDEGERPEQMDCK